MSVKTTTRDEDETFLIITKDTLGEREKDAKKSSSICLLREEEKE